MALGFSSHYKHDNQASFGALTKGSYNNNESESSGTNAYVPSLFVGHSSLSGLEYDNCEFSSSVDIDYSQYSTVIADGSCSETAGSVAFAGDSGCSIGGDSSGGCASFSGGGGMSCASFTC